MATTEDYLSGGPFDLAGNLSHSLAENTYHDINQTAENFRERFRDFERLSVQNCFQAYSTQYLSARGDLLLVQKKVGKEYYQIGAANELFDSDGYSIPDYVLDSSRRSYPNYAYSNGLPYVSQPTNYPSYEWACPLDSLIPCNPGNKTETRSPDRWEPYGDIVQYCWSENVEEICKIGFCLNFAITVMICNFVKVTGMFLTFKMHKKGALITTGDAIESFLEKEDVTTRGLCTYSTDRIRRLWGWNDSIKWPGPEVNIELATCLGMDHEWLLGKSKEWDELQFKQWESRHWYWGSSATRKRWVGCLAL